VAGRGGDNDGTAAWAYSAARGTVRPEIPSLLFPAAGPHGRRRTGQAPADRTSPRCHADDLSNDRMYGRGHADSYRSVDRLSG